MRREFKRAPGAAAIATNSMARRPKVPTAAPRACCFFFGEPMRGRAGKGVLRVLVEAARGLVHYAAWLKDAHPRKVGASASKAKLYASEMVNRVVYKAVQAHGALGYSRETDVERMYRDARVITIYEGTSEVQRMIIARELLGTPEKQKVVAS